MPSLEPIRVAELESPELLRRVLAQHEYVKLAGPTFEARHPDRETARLLVDAWRGGLAPAWLTAYLLGCLRSRESYDVVLAILEGDARLLSESYAGVALVKIAGAEAAGDLLRVMQQGKQLRGREGALHGLGSLCDLTLVPNILAAVRARLVRAHVAGSVLARMGVPDEALADWLHSADDIDRAVAIEAAVARLLPTGGRPRPALARAVEAAVHGDAVKLSPQIRRALTNRIDEILRAK